MGMKLWMKGAKQTLEKASNAQVINHLNDQNPTITKDLRTC